MKETPRIAIIGAGPAGLTLARILYVGGVEATVFERDPDAQFRPQGGTLDLHPETGQFALRRAGLEAEFTRMARYDDQGSRLYDGDGTLLLADDEAADGERPEVDRTALRDALLASLPADTIRWGKALREVRPREDGSYDLIFGDETAGPFDLVVGADGAWSKVRPLVSRYTPQYSGLTFVEFGIDDADRLHPQLSQLVGRGKIGIESGARSMIVQRNANAHLRGYAIFRVPSGWAEQTFDFGRPAVARERLASEFEGWAPQFLDLIRASNDNLCARQICALPVGHHWQNRIGVTLIGDAAHVMSPFGGEGVNAAMRDAADLADYLLQLHDWREAVRRYEEEMFVRVTGPAADAAEAAATELSHLGTELTLMHLKSHMTDREQTAVAV